MLNTIKVFIQVFLFERFLLGFILKSKLQQSHQVFGGHIFFQTLVTATEIGLFDLLHKEGALTQKQIAEKLNLAIKPVRIILLGLVSVDFLKKKGELYSLRFSSRRYLVSTSPYNILAFLKWQKYINYKAMMHLTESVQKNTNIGLIEFQGTEKTLYERLEHTPHLNQIFQDAMEDISKQATPILAGLLDTTKSKYIVDVGGGNGTVLIALARKNLNLRGAVMDLSSIKEISVNHIEKQGFKQRIGFIVGDCFKDPFPKEVDMILFSHFFTIWSEERSTQLLKKCYEALPSGGKVVIFNMMQNDSEDGPLTAAYGSPYFLTIATGEGMLYCWKDYEQWFRNAGFMNIQKITLPINHGIIIGTK